MAGENISLWRSIASAPLGGDQVEVRQGDQTAEAVWRTPGKGAAASGWYSNGSLLPWTPTEWRPRPRPILAKGVGPGSYHR